MNDEIECGDGAQGGLLTVAVSLSAWVVPWPGVPP